MPSEEIVISYGPVPVAIVGVPRAVRAPKDSGWQFVVGFGDVSPAGTHFSQCPTSS